MGLQAMCAAIGLPIDLTFVKDSNKEKMELIKKKLKVADRLVWIDYGLSCDKESIKTFVMKYDGFNCIVLPSVKEGVDWDMFRKKVSANNTEPIGQMGLTFDTTVGKCINKEEDFYTVTSTTPGIWAIDAKATLKKIKDKKSNGLTLPPTVDGFFELCLRKGVKVVAATRAQTFGHFTHECVGNLMNMAGLKVSK